MARARSRSEPTLILATANRAKARELAELLADIPFRITSLAELPAVSLPPEGESSYADNALTKARAVAAATGRLALADDSGIEVDALGGRPGVLSARFGGEGLDDEGRNREMLRALDGVPPNRRTARYRCLIAIVAPSGREALAEGIVEGVLLDAPRGNGGFGYDPLFYYPSLGATFAEISTASKHAISHRGRAIAHARQILMEWAAEGP